MTRQASQLYSNRAWKNDRQADNQAGTISHRFLPRCRVVVYLEKGRILRSMDPRESLVSPEKMLRRQAQMPVPLPVQLGTTSTQGFLEPLSPKHRQGLRLKDKHQLQRRTGWFLSQQEVHEAE